MSTGNLEFSLNGLNVQGRFENGLLIMGSVQIGDIKYIGTFENGLLHGDNCITCMGDAVYNGTYVAGMFTCGKYYKNSILRMEGNFHTYGKYPILHTGTKYTTDAKYTGKYDRLGSLIEGTCLELKTGHAYNGKFVDDILVSGIVEYHNNNVFTVEYESQYDTSLHCNLLTNCTVRGGQLNELCKKQLIFVCCQGHSSELHRFYLKYLDHLDVLALLNLTETTLNVPHDQQIYLNKIVHNLNNMK
jgi:hypothetical protein